jgi:hypothetical protein
MPYVNPLDREQTVTNPEHTLDRYAATAYAAEQGGEPNCVQDLINALDAISHMSVNYGDIVAQVANDAKEALGAGLRDGYFVEYGPVG